MGMKSLEPSFSVDVVVVLIVLVLDVDGGLSIASPFVDGVNLALELFNYEGLATVA